MSVIKKERFDKYCSAANDKIHAVCTEIDSLLAEYEKIEARKAERDKVLGKMTGRAIAVMVLYLAVACMLGWRYLIPRPVEITQDFLPLILFLGIPLLWLALSAAVISLKMRKEFNDVRERYAMPAYYHTFSSEHIRDYVDSMNSGRAKALLVDSSEQRFNAERDTLTDFIDDTYGTLRLTHEKGVPFMQNFFGKGQPEAQGSIQLYIGLPEPSFIQEWKKFPDKDVIVLPFQRFILFPSMTWNAWQYLLFVGDDGNMVGEMLALLCRFVLLDIIRAKLQDAVGCGLFIMSETDAIVDEEDLAPYFTEGGEMYRKHREIWTPFVEMAYGKERELARLGLMGQSPCVVKDQREWMQGYSAT